MHPKRQEEPRYSLQAYKRLVHKKSSHGQHKVISLDKKFIVKTFAALGMSPRLHVDGVSQDAWGPHLRDCTG